MVNGKTRVFLLLGSPVVHSVSPAMQTAAFRALGLNAIYAPLQCDAPDVADIMRIVSQSGGGGNVTLPFKGDAAQALAQVSPLVRETGACNTFWMEGQGVAGENTDVAGVNAALDLLEAPATAWLLLGTGGSARAVVAAAQRKGAAIAVKSRTAAKQAEFERWAAGLGVKRASPEECQVVINATPLGLHPSDPLPIPPAGVPGVVAALDLVYGRDGTRWSRAMADRGARSADGREAVVAQGAAAFKCWFPDADPPVEVMRAVVNARLTG